MSDGATFYTEWQDHLMKTAKANLLKDGHVCPMGFILAKSEDVPEAFRTELEPLRDARGGVNPTLVMACIPLPPPFDEMLRVIAEDFILPDKREAYEASISLLTEIAPSALGSKDKAMKVIFEKAVEALGLDMMDVQMATIRRLVKAFRATAWFHVNEGYVANAAAVEEGKTSPRETPGSRECVTVVMETYGASRWLTLPFTRAVRDTGEVQSVGELMDSGLSPLAFEGRMFGVLPPRNAPA